MSDRIISHNGKIVSIHDETIVVEIVSQEACASCSASALCSSTSSKKKEIIVHSNQTYNYYIGQEVSVSAKRELALKAVLLAYVLPLFIMLFAVILISHSFSDIIVALIALIAVAMYYFILYLFRTRIEKDYKFYIEAINLKSGL